jgi:hypothetical protein
MCSMMKFWTTLACLSVLGCAEGSPSQPVTVIDPPAVMEAPKCGNGTVDVAVGEQCDCGNMVTGQCRVMDKTCEMVGRGGGMLLCNAAPKCTFDFSLCADNSPPTGGTGAMQGTGGTGR